MSTTIDTMKPLDFSKNLKSLLLQRLEWFERRQLELLNRSGIEQLTLAQGRVFAQLKGQDLSISDLAKGLGVSRQAAQKTVASLVDKNLLELRESEDNHSAKIVHITHQGHQFRSEIGRAMETVEQQVRREIGSEKFDLLKQLLMQSWESESQ